MTAYPDTSFLCALYRSQGNTAEAVQFRSRSAEPIYVTSLLEFEFLQSIRLQVFLHGIDRTKGYSSVEAERMLLKWESDLATGEVQLVPFELASVTEYARSLSGRYTTSGGHRTLDILHVATAVHLGAQQFLTFDSRQKKLAELVGLETPL